MDNSTFHDFKFIEDVERMCNLGERHEYFHLAQRASVYLGGHKLRDLARGIVRTRIKIWVQSRFRQTVANILRLDIVSHAVHLGHFLHDLILSIAVAEERTIHHRSTCAATQLAAQNASAAGVAIRMMLAGDPF